MIYHVNGTLEYSESGFCVIDCMGVGYKLTVSDNTFIYKHRFQKWQKLHSSVELVCAAKMCRSGSAIHKSWQIPSYLPAFIV